MLCVHYCVVILYIIYIIYVCTIYTAYDALLLHVKTRMLSMERHTRTYIDTREIKKTRKRHWYLDLIARHIGLVVVRDCSGRGLDRYNTVARKVFTVCIE